MKNWFMTKNDGIEDLNRFIRFYVKPQNISVIGIVETGTDITFGGFDTVEEARLYLETIYHQLWDGNYPQQVEDEEEESVDGGCGLPALAELQRELNTRRSLRMNAE